MAAHQHPVYALTTSDLHSFQGALAERAIGEIGPGSPVPARLRNELEDVIAEHEERTRIRQASRGSDNQDHYSVRQLTTSELERTTRRELVRRDPATRWACPADDLGPENIGEPMARKTVQSLRHTLTITSCPKTDTHGRQGVGKGFAAPGDNCPRAARVRRGPTSPRPPHRCPSCGTVLDGGPVVFRCAGCGRGIHAPGLDVEYRPLGRLGRAV